MTIPAPSATIRTAAPAPTSRPSIGTRTTMRTAPTVG